MPEPQIRVTPIGDLHPDPKNANLGTDEGERLLKESLTRNGAGRSILLDRNGVIIAGNKTAGQAAEVGIREVIVVQSDGSQLVAVQRTDLDLEKDPKATALALADNRVAQLDLAWDEDVLAAIASQTPDIMEGLWTEAEIRKLLTEEPEQQPETSEPGIDAREELRQKWGAEVGQIWSLGRHRMLIGDSTDQEQARRLMGTELAVCVFTDPPYGVAYESESQGDILNDQHTADALVNFLRPALDNLVRFSQDTAAFYIWHATSTRRDFEWAMDAAGLQERQYITWVKDGFTLGRADYHWQTEPCFYAEKAGQRATWYGDRTQSTVWRASTSQADNTAVSLSSWLHLSDGAGGDIWIRNRAPRNQKARHLRLNTGQRLLLLTNDGASNAWEISRDPSGEYIHPTQKPASLAQRALENSSQPGDLCLDLFLGSGSTLIGAERSSRRCYGMELDPKFAAGILERFEQETGTTPERTT